MFIIFVPNAKNYFTFFKLHMFIDKYNNIWCIMQQAKSQRIEVIIKYASYDAIKNDN